MSFIGDLFGGDDTEQVSIAQTNTSTEPPAYAKPFLERVLSESETLFETPSTFFPGQTYIDFSAPTLAALNAGEARAMAGTPLTPATTASVLRGLDFSNPATDMLMQTARGDFVNQGNPYLDAALQPAIDRIQGQFSQAGRLGSGANVAAMTSALAPIYAQDYANERALQQQAQTALGGLAQGDVQLQQRAAALAPTAAAFDYDDIGRLAQFGQARELKAAEQLADEMARFDFLQNEPAQRLQRFASLVRGGTMGGQSSSTQPIYANPTSTGIGNLGTLATAAGTVGKMFGLGVK
tara:strand:- start:2301 stop:3185 length:885 start_codon:yes stop_codon:yes gene_type:complete